MKHTIYIAFTAMVIFGISGCSDKNSLDKKISELRDNSKSTDAIFDKDTSYALGMDIGTSMKRAKFIPDFAEFLLGIMDVVYDQKTRIPNDDIGQIINETFTAHNEKLREEAAALEEKNKAEEQKYLQENKEKPGVIVTESGLQYEILEEGYGEKPTEDDTVSVHYKGTLINGEVFDSSYERGEPYITKVAYVIQGWIEGLQLMPVGSKYRFHIPSGLGYGAWGSEPKIPPYSTLIFEIELLDINPEENQDAESASTPDEQ